MKNITIGNCRIFELEDPFSLSGRVGAVLHWQAYEGFRKDNYVESYVDNYQEIVTERQELFYVSTYDAGHINSGIRLLVGYDRKHNNRGLSYACVRLSMIWLFELQKTKNYGNIVVEFPGYKDKRCSLVRVCWQLADLNLEERKVFLYVRDLDQLEAQYKADVAAEADEMRRHFEMCKADMEKKEFAKLKEEAKKKLEVGLADVSARPRRRKGTKKE